MKSNFMLMVAAATVMMTASWADSPVTLPEGYRQLPYFNLTAAQWVDTGYFGKCTDRLEMTFAFPSNSVKNVGTCYAFWCARSGSRSLSMSAFIGATAEGVTGNLVGTFRFDRNTTPSSFTEQFLVPDDAAVRVVSADYGTGLCTLDGEPVYTFPSTAAYTPGGRLVLFASHTCGLGLDPSTSSMDGNLADYRFYRFRVFSASGALVRDYVPACKLDETDPVKRYGLFETVTGAFCTNNGSRPFGVPPLETVTLTEDTDLRGAGTLATFAKRFDLNGHKLTLDALATPTEIVNSAEDARGELHLDFASDVTTRELVVSGNVAVVKEGAGNLTLAGGIYGGVWCVAAGTLTVDTAFAGITANAGDPLVVKAGALLDFPYSNRLENRLPSNAQVVVDGGELRLNGVCPFPVGMLPDVFVTNGTVTVVHDRAGHDVHLLNLTLADSVLRFDGVVPGYAASNSTYYHGLGVVTVTTVGTSRFERPDESPNYIFCSLTDATVTLDITDGTFPFSGKFKAYECVLTKTGAGRLTLEEGAEFYLEQLQVNAGTVTVNEVFSRAVTKKLIIGGEAVSFDLTAAGTAIGNDAFAFALATAQRAAGATVTLDVHGRALANGERLVAFATCPEGLAFALDAATVAAGGTLTVTADGVFYGGAGAMAAHTAVWTGAAGTSDGSDPGNWASTNVVGEAVSAVPTSDTWIGDVTLTADADWRMIGPVKFAGTVNLNGHRLQVAGLAGQGLVTDGRYDLTTTTNGTSHITVSNSDALKFRNTPIANLFNDKPFYTSQQRIIVQNAKLPFSISYDFGEQTVIDSYRIQGCDNYSRNPSAWTFSGSDDGETWTELDVRTDWTNFSCNCLHQFDFTNETAYRYYRLTLVATPGAEYLELCQLEYGRSSVPAGELVVEVPAGETNANASVRIDDNVRLVKAGAGTYVAAAANPSYRGGTEVTGGVFAYGTSAYPAGMGKIAVSAGATLDFNGFTDAFRLDYPLELAGTVRQQLAKSQDGYNTSLRSFGNITLTGDATIAGKWFYFGRNSSSGVVPGTIRLNGHRLTFDLLGYIGLGQWFPEEIGAGSIAFVGTAGEASLAAETLEVWNFDAVPCTFGPGVSLKINHSFHVSDFTYLSDRWAGKTYGSLVNVHGRFTPGAFRPPVLLCDGSTLDLSGATDVFDVAGLPGVIGAEQNLDESGEIDFAPDATITLDVHGRAFKPGEQIVRFARPAAAGVTFVFDAATAAKGVAPFVTDAGVFYGGDAYVHTAAWTGRAGDGDITNPRNWDCRDLDGNPVADGLPGEPTTVTVTGTDVNIQFPANATPAYRSLVITNCALAADCDWSGIDSACITGTILLNGHKLQTSGLDGTWTCRNSTDGYEQLDYLVLTAANATTGSHFELGYTPLSSDRLEARFLITAKVPTGRFYCLWCARSGSSNTYTTFIQQGSIVRYDYKGTSTGTSGTVSANEVHMAAIDPTAGKRYLDAAEATLAKQAFTVGGPLFIGATSDSPATHHFNGRLYGFRVTGSDGIVKYDYVPARRVSDGVLGLLDLVTGDFRTDSGNATTPLGAGEVVGVVGDATTGELHVAVPDDGETHFNNAVKLAGSLRLVLDGPGRFAANRANQTYTGGTIVAGGVATTFHAGNIDPAVSRFWGVYRSRITVEKGAEFNMKGLSNYFINYEIVLAGGRWTCLDGVNMDQRINGLGAMTLTDDSEIVANRNIYFRNSGTVNLNGHTLTITLEDGVELGFHCTTVFSNGTVVVRGGRIQGYAAGYEGTPINAKTANFVFEGGYIYQSDATAVLEFGGYTAGEPMAGFFNRGVTPMNVYGRFTPVSDDFYGCTLQDGASIDLSGKTETWSMTSPRAQGMDTVTVADGATVTVELGGRRVRGNTRLIAWEVEPRNVTWQVDDASRARGYHVVPKADGLYLCNGFFIIVR